MTTHSWKTLRTKACQAFQELPGTKLEQDILQHWQHNPGNVERTITYITNTLNRNPGIGSGWAILRTELARQHEPDITTPDPQAITRTEQWLNTVGKHYRWHEIEDELYGPRGRLPHANQTTKDHLQAIWETHQQGAAK